MSSDPAFIESTGRMHTFLDRLSRHRVRAVFGHALTLEWDTPTGQAVRLAHISPNGLVWTDVGVAKLPGALVPAHAYVEQVAHGFGLGVNRTAFGDIWTVCTPTGRLPNIRDMMDKLDGWAEAIEALTDCLSFRLAVERPSADS